MISIKIILIYVAGILTIIGVTAVLTTKTTNNTYHQQLTEQQKKGAENHEAWRHMMADGPADTPPLGAALNNGKTILNDRFGDSNGEK